jgi:L-fucose isomerase-like protein
MPKVALMTVSDGRAAVHRGIAGFAADVEDRNRARAAALGALRRPCEDVVWTSELAVNEARRLAAARPDLTIINIPVWAFQHFTMRAASELPGPLLLFSNKQAIWANGRARVRTSLALAMQKVVGSSPIIRSQNPRKSGVFVFWEAT